MRVAFCLILERIAVNYRQYISGDFAQLYAIEETCFQPPFRFPRRYMRSLLESADTVTWIGEEEGQMAGFAIADRERRIDGLVAYIQTIEVQSPCDKSAPPAPVGNSDPFGPGT